MASNIFRHAVAGKALRIEHSPSQMEFLDIFQSVGGKVWPASDLMVKYLSDTKISHDFDGIIIGGGSDISPFHYQDSPESENYKLSTRKKLKLLRYPLELFNYFFGSENKYDPIRDQLEKDLIEKAISKKLPIRMTDLEADVGNPPWTVGWSI